ncbi:MAG: CtsR family transcriptional regulator, partial [bacterium]
VVESRRGGGGYIRITRVQVDPAEIMMHVVNSIGQEIDYRSAAAILANAVALNALTERAARVLLAGVSEAALRPVPQEQRDEARASILKQMLTRLIA